jgi:UDP-N-acetylmuramoyl-L-alanyl-D-glutamate--2,6-diaminopimelate ligase
MGKVAARTADLSVITSDNPRSEEPQSIIEEVETGVREIGVPRLGADELARAARGYCALADRRLAIEVAIRAARSGDSVLLAGKGHETYQIIGEERQPFDDRAEARSAIAALTGGG